MRARWLFKTEPSEFSYDDLERAGETVWDGIANALALIHLRKVRKGDLIVLYHTGGEKAAVGLVRAASDPYPDPKARDDKRVVVDLVPYRRWKTPVPLAAVKRDARLKDWELVTFSRLSVMPVRVV